MSFVCHGTDTRSRKMMRASSAGLGYFAVVFAAGFALGTLRAAVLVPRLGEIAAVALELPVILGISWPACRWLVARFDVPPVLNARFVMGGLAFATLMAAELGLSLFAFGRTFSDHLEHYRHLPGLLGLGGQLAFAAFPLMQRAMRPHPEQPVARRR